MVRLVSMYLTCRNNSAKNAVNITMASNQIVDFFIFLLTSVLVTIFFYFKDRTFIVTNLTNKPLFCLTYPLKIKKNRKKRQQNSYSMFNFRISQVYKIYLSPVDVSWPRSVPPVQSK